MKNRIDKQIEKAQKVVEQWPQMVRNATEFRIERPFYNIQKEKAMKPGI